MVASAPAYAQPLRPQVVLTSNGAAPEHPVLSRLRAELAREGYEVVDEAARDDVRASATVSFEPREPELKLDVSVRLAAGPQVTRRSFHGDVSETRTIVLRAVEYIRANQLQELPADAAVAQPAPSPERTPQSTSSPPSPREATHRFEPEAGAVAFLGVPGADPALGASLALGYAITPRYRVRLRAAVAPRNTTQTARGSARFSHSLVSLGGAWQKPLGLRLSLEVSASAGAYLITSSGQSSSDLQPRTTFTAVPAGTLGAGARYRPTLAVPLRVHLRGEALLTTRRPKVRFGADTVERMSQPSALASLGLDWSF